MDLRCHRFRHDEDDFLVVLMVLMVVPLSSLNLSGLGTKGTSKSFGGLHSTQMTFAPKVMLNTKTQSESIA